MKKLLFSLSLMGILLSARLTHGQNVIPVTASTVIKSAAISFKKSTHDFGKIKMGTPVTAEFIFTNTGNAPLSITSVAPSCGCTVGSYTQEPVMPGKTGFIKATYNAKNAGSFNKSISVTANTATENMQLFIKGEVVN